MLSLTSKNSCVLLHLSERTCFVLPEDRGTELWTAVAAHVSGHNTNA